MSVQGRNQLEPHRCLIKVSLSVLVPWCLSAGPQLKVCYQGQRYILLYEDYHNLDKLSNEIGIFFFFN